MKVPQVDINAPLPILDEPVVDTLMIKVRQEWRGGIVVFVLFVAMIEIIGYFYNTQIIRQPEKSESQTTQRVSEPKTSLAPAVEVRPVFAVWNGSGVAGAAAKMAEKLKAAGYEVVETKNAPKEQVGTTIEVTSEMENQRNDIARIVGMGADPARTVLEGDLDYNVRVILGK